MVVHGKVIDNHTGEALIGATVYAVPGTGPNRGVTTTDYDGYFETNQIAANEKVGISYVGYITEQFDHKDGIYALTESTSFLDGVTVVGKKQESPSPRKNKYMWIAIVALLLFFFMAAFKIYKSKS